MEALKAALESMYNAPVPGAGDAISSSGRDMLNAGSGPLLHGPLPVDASPWSEDEGSLDMSIQAKSNEDEMSSPPYSTTSASDYDDTPVPRPAAAPAPPSASVTLVSTLSSPRGRVL